MHSSDNANIVTIRHQEGANKSKNSLSYPPSKSNSNFKNELERAVTEMIVRNLREKNANKRENSSVCNSDIEGVGVTGGDAKVRYVNHPVKNNESNKSKAIANNIPTTINNTNNADTVSGAGNADNDAPKSIVKNDKPFPTHQPLKNLNNSVSNAAEQSANKTSNVTNSDDVSSNQNEKKNSRSKNRKLRARKKGKMKIVNIDAMNVRSMAGREKKKHVEWRVETSESDFFLVSETWLNNQIKKDEEIAIPGFALLARSDRKTKEKAGDLGTCNHSDTQDSSDTANPDNGKNEPLKSGGGGVAVFGRLSVLPDEKNIVKYNNISVSNEMCQIAAAHIPGTLIICVYNAIFGNDKKKNTDEMLKTLSDIISETRNREPGCSIIIGGDFNIPKLIDPKTFLLQGPNGGDGGDVDSVEDKFVKFISDNDLDIRNHKPTHTSGNVLDFFMVDRITHEDDKTSTIVIDDYMGVKCDNVPKTWRKHDFDHKAVRLSLNINMADNKIKTITRIKPKTFDKKAALEWLTKSKILDSIKFGDTEEEIEEANRQLTDIIKTAQTRFCETETVKIGRTREQFLADKRSKTVKNKLKRLNKQIKASIRANDNNKAEELKEIYREISRNEDDKNTEAALRECDHDPQKLSGYYKGRSKPSTPPIRDLDDPKKMHYDDEDKAEVLLEQFSRSMSEPSTFTPSKPKEATDMKNIVVTNRMILDAMSTLKKSSAPGPDGIYSRIIVELKHTLAPFIKKSLQHELNAGYVPKSHKLAHITPIPKKGNSSLAANQRPIQKTDIISKVKEYTVVNEMEKYREEGGKIHQDQHGFRKGRSTETSQLIFWNTVTKLINDKKATRNSSVHVLFVDFSKAFDRVGWRWIMETLEANGINDNNASRWYMNFLGTNNDRYIKVQVNEALSKPRVVQSGNCQGSKSGPHIFNMCVEPLIKEILALNDDNANFPNSNKMHITMYADDMKLFIHVESEIDQKKLQSAINIIQNFCVKSQMSMNVKKTCLMKMRKKGTPKDEYKYYADGDELQETTIFDDLGTIITDTMDNAPHYQKIRNKIRRSIAIVKKNFWKRSQTLITNIYKCYIVPVATQGAAIAFKCPSYLYPNSGNSGGNNPVCIMLMHQFHNVFDLGYLRRGIEANLDLPRQCILSWLRTMNRMTFFSENPGHLKFSECWKKGLHRDKIWPIFERDATLNDGNLLDNGHKFFNEIPKDIREAKPKGEKSIAEICRFRSKKISSWFKKINGVVDYEEAKKQFIKRVEDVVKKNAREKAKKAKKAAFIAISRKSGNPVTGYQTA